ncbi:hypothetical protein ACJMK2_030971 [Sinanodonta woodiana]|uniref:Rab proteins geranylgeranyltransferase component A n=1 Tax=Sinanodonta woodiana TaxID=1069815 RepID=A0ABD3WYQ6_SINWO
MAADLPSEFDVIVLGTGMPESIFAAACSRIGQTVLHIDRNDHYSGDWSSFSLNGIQKWVEQQKISCGDDLELSQTDEASILKEGEYLLKMPLKAHNFKDIKIKFHIEDKEEVPTKQEFHAQEKVDLCFSEEKGNPEVESGRKDEANEKQLENIGVDPLPVDTNINNNASQTSNETQLQDFSRDENQSQSPTDQKLSSDKETENPTEAPYTSVSVDDSDKRTMEGNAISSCEAQLEIENKEDMSSANENEKKCKNWSPSEIQKEWRKFNLDLSPKVLYCAGDMVELLITSDIAKYCEFKTVTRVLTLLNGKLEKVPCSRADVFSSKLVSMLEKRMLMKFLTFCMDYEKQPEEYLEYLGKPFSEFLASKKLSENIKHFVQHSISMTTDKDTTDEGLRKTKKFLQSLSRYGNTAFLWALYGSGELPQSFCRMCAVFGGVYCLHFTASQIILNKEGRCQGIITTAGQRIDCKWLVMESSYSPKEFVSPTNSRYISRAILLTDRPLLPTDSQELSMLCLPCPDDPYRPIHVLELPPGSMAAPQGIYVFHLTRLAGDHASVDDDLSFAVKALFKETEDDDKPKVLWSLYFRQNYTSQVERCASVPENVFLMPGPGPEIDADAPVHVAKDLFHKLYPGEEFLPKAPNPEDIIYIDNSEASASGTNQSDFKEQSDDTGKTQDLDASKLQSNEVVYAEPSSNDQSAESNDQSGIVIGSSVEIKENAEQNIVDK